MLRVPPVHAPLTAARWARRSVGLAILFAACSGRPTYERNTNLSRADHAQNFPIAQGTHQDVTCNDCHGDFDTFSQFACTGCHVHAKDVTDAAHLGITAGYRYQPTACFQCHPKGDGATDERFNHAPYFPIREGAAHQGLHCLDCHGKDVVDRTNITCTGACHPQATLDPAHVVVGGYEYVDKTCLKCHADSVKYPVAEHLPFKIVPPSPHYQQLCETCHPRVRADKPFGIDFTYFDCTPCHAATDLAATHDALAGYQYQSTTCVQAGCHPNGLRP